MKISRVCRASPSDGLHFGGQSPLEKLTVNSNRPGKIDAACWHPSSVQLHVALDNGWYLCAQPRFVPMRDSLRPLPPCGAGERDFRLDASRRFRKDPCHLVWQVNKIRKRRSQVRNGMRLSPPLASESDSPAGQAGRGLLQIAWRLNRRAQFCDRTATTRPTASHAPMFPRIRFGLPNSLVSGGGSPTRKRGDATREP